jgi:hypothetical protein
LHLIVSALWPHGFDLQISRKPGGNLTAEDMRMKIWFAAADNDRVSRRKLMAHREERCGLSNEKAGQARADKDSTTGVKSRGHPISPSAGV